MEGKGRLLIVDDEPEIVFFLEVLFLEKSYSVMTASTPDEALQLLANHNPEILITDIRMPGMNGLELIARAKEIHPDLECIVLTAYEQVDYAIDAVSLGAVRYLRKSLDFDELEKIVHSNLEKNRALRRIRADEEKYRQIFESSRDAIILFDAKNGRLIDANRMARKLYGYDKEEFLQLHYRDIVVESAASGASATIIVNGQSERVSRSVHKKKEGGIFPAEVTVAPFMLRGKKMLSTIVRDLSKHEETEKKNLSLVAADPLCSRSAMPLSKEILPICAHCKDVRDNSGHWRHLESYLYDHSGTIFSHGICPDCVKRLYPDLSLKLDASDHGCSKEKEA